MRLVRQILSVFLLATVMASGQAMPLPSTLGPDHVVVVYNRRVPIARAIATAYGNARGIPAESMIPLDCPDTETITREEFRTGIQEPLRREFAARNWWTPANAGNTTIGAEPKKRVLALIHGMPMRVKRDDNASAGKNGIEAMNEASVDSELMLLGLFNYPIAGPINNPYFRKKTDFATLKEPPMYLVARIDGPDANVAMRLATEAVQIEKAGGPWGKTILDIYGKGGDYQIGDDWIARIYNQSWERGIPAQIDRHPWTLPEAYPAGDCAFYFGWYDTHANGFMLDPEFRYKPGAVAVHLHSFSAESLRQPGKFWAGPILAKGATATLGNVWEPYLQVTHQFDLFHQALMEGYTLAEAAGMSIPATSWMNVVIGDPLYRPMARRLAIEPAVIRAEGDNSWKAVRVAIERWKSDPEEAAKMLRQSGSQNKDGILVESAGLLEYKLDRMLQAQKDFETASSIYKKGTDQIRCRLHAAECLLARKEKTFALQLLRETAKEFSSLPQAKAVNTHIQRLDPPPPPPAKGKP
ncbi:MAG: TIGR03790 family protein [Verrucomicrobiales bacterium]